MINFRFLNHAVGITDGNEFRVLYLIANTLGLNKTKRCRVYRDLISDKLNISPKTVSRLTNSLVGKGLLKKDIVFEDGKSKDYYSLNLDEFGTENVSNVDTGVLISASNWDRNVPLNNINKSKKINKSKNKNNEEIEVKVEIENKEIGINNGTHRYGLPF